MESIKERIRKVLEKSNSLIAKRRITREAEWQTWLYCDLRDEFLNEPNIRILLEGRIRKGNDSIVWFSDKKLGQLKEILTEDRFIEIDNGGWIKVSLENSELLSAKNRNILIEESYRRFYVDVLIEDINENKPLGIIEMKFHQNLDETYLYDDVEKLKRIRSVLNDDCLLLASGYRLKDNQYFSISVE